MQQLAVASVARKCLQETSRRAARTVDARAGACFHMFFYIKDLEDSNELFSEKQLGQSELLKKIVSDSYHQ